MEKYSRKINIICSCYTNFLINHLYNITLIGLDFDKPFSLYGYCIFNSQLIDIRKESSYFIEYGIYDIDTVLQILLENINTVEQKVLLDVINAVIITEKLYMLKKLTDFQ